MLRIRQRILKLALSVHGILALLCLSVSAHVAEQFYSSFDEERGILEVNFDVGYAIPASRDDPAAAQPKRDWLLNRSAAEHEKLRKETEAYLRGYIRFSSGGQTVDYAIVFPDFEVLPPAFPKLLNEGAYYTVELIPQLRNLDGFAVSVINKDAPKLIVALENGASMDFRVLEGKDAPLALVEASLSQTTEPSVIARYTTVIGIGFRHVIPEGADHILFIIGICLSAHGFRNLLAQSLLFTLAHSISMALVISGWFPVYRYGVSSWIEPLIALSISFLAVEALLQRERGKCRYTVIACFGLIHGLGFAGSMGSSLQSVTPDDGHWITVLLWANLGIELAQALLVFTVFTLFYTMRKSRMKSLSNAEPIIRVVTASAVGIIGLVWFFQRV